MVVQNLVDLDALLFELWIEVVLQVRLAEPPMLVVAFFEEDLSNVVPFYIFATVNKGPWLWYIFQPLNASFSGFRRTCNFFC
jgi:hypothetical protein